MRDEGHIAPAAAPTVFVPPHARSYPPTLDRTTRIVRTALRLFVPPCTRLYRPAPVCTTLRSFVHMFFVRRLHLLPCARVYCSTLAFTAYVLSVKQNIVSI